MTEYKRFRLDGRAHPFIESRLRSGHSLAKKLLRVAAIRDGEVSTVLPAQVPESELYDFTSGGKLPFPNAPEWKQGGGTVAIPVHNYRPALQREITQLIGDAKVNICVIQNALAQPRDPVVQRYRSPIAIFGDEVYHIIAPLTGGQRIDEDLVAAALTEANAGHRLVAALANLPDFSFPTGQSLHRLSSQQLRRLAERTSVLFIDAYDGEGYLRWMKGQAGMGPSRGQQ